MAACILTQVFPSEEKQGKLLKWHTRAARFSSRGLHQRGHHGRQAILGSTDENLGRRLVYLVLIPRVHVLFWLGWFNGFLSFLSGFGCKFLFFRPCLALMFRSCHAALRIRVTAAEPRFESRSFLNSDQGLVVGGSGLLGVLHRGSSLSVFAGFPVFRVPCMSDPMAGSGI